MAGISAVLRDNCYLLLGDTRIYPNLYILIVAKPAMRKAKPLNSISELAKYINNTKVIEGRTSVQAIIQRLSEVERLKDGKSIQHASGLVYSEEFSALLTEDAANIPILTDLYDFKYTYTSSLVTRSSVKLTNVVLSMLVASNEELLKDVFTNRAIYGGLLSRCLIVYGDKVRHRNSLMFEDPKKYDPSNLRKILQEVSQLRGIFRITDDAKKFYDEWYNNVCPILEQKANNTGAEGRIHTNVLKLAMVLAVSKYRKLEIDIPLIEQAIDNCFSLFANYKRLTMGSGRGKDRELKISFLKCLWEVGKEHKYTMSRSDIVCRTLGDMNSEEMDSVVRNLMEGNLISTISKSGREESYFLTAKAIKYFESEFSK